MRSHLHFAPRTAHLKRLFLGAVFECPHNHSTFSGVFYTHTTLQTYSHPSPTISHPLQKPLYYILSSLYCIVGLLMKAHQPKRRVFAFLVYCKLLLLLTLVIGYLLRYRYYRIKSYGKSAVSCSLSNNGYRY
jgi:hypothetical protein